MNIQKISDLTSEDLQIYTSLSERELKKLYEPNGGVFIAESPKVILRALDAGYTPVSVLLEEGRTDGDHGLVLNRIGDIPVYMAPHSVLTEITGYELTSGMQCVMNRKPNPDVSDLVKDARRIAVLEDVMNPTNIGAIFRSAAALFIDAILLTSGCADPLYKRAARVSMGTVFQVPWGYLDNSRGDSVNITLHNLGFKTVSMALDNTALHIDDSIFHSIDKLAILLGTEGDGLAASTILDSDYKAIIPMSHGVDSLNVAAASAVAFYELSKKS